MIAIKRQKSLSSIASTRFPKKDSRREKDDVGKIDIVHSLAETFPGEYLNADKTSNKQRVFSTHLSYFGFV